MSQGSRAGPQGPEKPLPDLVRPVEAVDSHEPEPAAATNTEPIPAPEIELVIAPNLLDYLSPEELGESVPAFRRARLRRIKEPPKEPLPDLGTAHYLIDDEPEPAATTPAEELEDQEAGRQENQKPASPKT
jgi:hypothetical protein